jgi:PEP-CTERM motif
MILLGAKSWAKFALIAFLCFGAVSMLYGDSMIVTYSPAGDQTVVGSTLCGTDPQCWIGQQTFATNSIPAPGVFPTLYSYGGLTGNISGTYSSGMTMYKADEYGGAGGTGYYPEVFASTNGGKGSYTLTLTTSGNIPGVNYFGLWFSALDAGNQLQFLEDGVVVFTFTPADFISLVGACSGSNAFCGNPTTKFKGDDSGEQFAFLNFFDQGGYFNEIIFSEINGYDGGFESDNHTVAYLDPPTPPEDQTQFEDQDLGSVPEPGSFVLMMLGTLAFIGFSRFAVLKMM